MTTVKLSNLTLSELIDYEKACRLVCIKYEKSSGAWGKDISVNETNEFDAKFNEYNALHDKILNEIEKRLTNLETNGKEKKEV